MKIFDTSYLKPKRLIPICLIAFFILNATGYVLAINSAAHIIATKAIKDHFTPTGTTKVTLLPWGFNIRLFENDGDARFIYYVSHITGRSTISVSMVKEYGHWKITALSETGKPVERP